MRHLVVPLLALLAVASNPRRTFEVDYPRDFARMHFETASSVHGKPLRFEVTLDSERDECDGHTLYDCVSSDRVHRTAWLRKEAERGADSFEVRAWLTGRPEAAMKDDTEARRLRWIRK